MKKSVLLLVVPLLLAGCKENDNAVEALRADIISLKRENAQLRMEVLSKADAIDLEKRLAGADSQGKIQDMERKIDELRRALQFHIKILSDNHGILKENTNFAVEALELRLDRLEGQPTKRKR